MPKSLLAILIFIGIIGLFSGTLSSNPNKKFKLEYKKITSGPANHFFGYIGHVQNIPWNGNGRYILALRTKFQDRMPGPDDPADIILIDTHQNYSIRKLDETCAWNPQQGTMFYWNPKSPDTQFFFNDRDKESGEIFCVLFDISEGENGIRIKEYRYTDSPIGNGGVAQKGGNFLGINYARMARLRPVTGYKEARDWTVNSKHPANDGIFKVDVSTGNKNLLVSFKTLASKLSKKHDPKKIPSLFINHTLWNREDDRIFFFARAGWSGNRKGTKINQPFVMNSDGSNLKLLNQHIGGHPEWSYDKKMIGRSGKLQIVYDTEKQIIVDSLGTPEIFPDPEGDIALSPNGEWLVNGYKNKKQKKNFYVIYNLKNKFHLKSKGFEIGEWISGDLRQDPSPTWNRNNNQIMIPALSDDGKSRQLHTISIVQE